MSAIPQSVKDRAREADEFFTKTAEPDHEPQPVEPKAEEIETPQLEDSIKEPEPAEPTPDTKPDQDFKSLYEDTLNRNKVLQGMIRGQVGERDRKIKELESQIASNTAAPKPTENNPLQGEVAQLKSTVEALTKQLSQPAAAPVAPQLDPIAENIREEHGDALADQYLRQKSDLSDLKEFVTSSVEPLKAQFNQTEQLRSQQDLDRRKSGDMTSLLAAEGIDFSRMNNDEGFNNYLDYFDRGTGKTLRETLADAWNAGDLQRSAHFFREYSGQLTQPEPSKPNQNQLQKSISLEPGGPESLDASVDQTRIHTGADIDALYKNLEIARRTGNVKEVARLEKLEMQQFSQRR